jgi:hypothetical protein
VGLDVRAAQASQLNAVEFLPRRSPNHRELQDEGIEQEETEVTEIESSLPLFPLFPPVVLLFLI